MRVLGIGRSLRAGSYNTLDCASRPCHPNSLRGQPVAVVGASTSIFGAVCDPAREPGSDDETLPTFERIAAELETRIGSLLEPIKHTTDSEEVIEHA